MDRERAKMILRFQRPWVSRKEPDEEAALRLAQNDPELAAVQKQAEAFHGRVHEQLSGIPVPDDLRARILAGKNIVRVPQWRSPAQLLAIAATVLLLGSALFYWLRPLEDYTIAGFRSRMVGFALREYRMDVLTPDLGVVRRSLADKGRPSDFELPPKLSTIPVKGGASLSWQDKPVSMVCFKWTEGETLYMFVLGSDELARRGAELQAIKGLTTVTWTSAGKTFLLAGHLPAESLAELVKS